MGKMNGMKQNWKGSCIAHITGTAGKQSCSEWCEGHGLQCVMAMDDASTEQQNQLRAWMPAGESSQCSVGNQYWQDRLHACDKEMNSQICACEKTSCLNPEGVPIMDPNMEDCTNKNFHVWPEGTEDVLDAKADDLTQMKMNGMKQDWKGSCIAHITSPSTEVKQSCSEWCEGHGLQCVMAMDDASTTQQNQLRAWMPAGESSQCSFGNQYWQDRLHGCDKEMNTQICACDKTVASVYSIGQYKAKTADRMDTAPTCPTNTAPLSSQERCEEYAKMAGKTFSTADLPNYPPGCSDRIAHPQFAGVLWNGAEGGTWDKHQGFTGEVALVCEPSLDAAAGLVSKNSKCHYSRDGISDERQFRLEGQATLEDCKERCLETSGCKFYSWTGTGKHAHVCMGCSDVKKFSEHQGFSLHALHRAGLESVSPVA